MYTHTHTHIHTHTGSDCDSRILENVYGMVALGHRTPCTESVWMAALFSLSPSFLTLTRMSPKCRAAAGYKVGKGRGRRKRGGDRERERRS